MSKQFINEVSRMKNLFDYKRGVVISEQKFLNEAEIPFPAGVSKEAYDEIMGISAENKKTGRGSYLFPTQAAEIDKKYGAGIFKKFTDAGGYDVLAGKSTFTTTEPGAKTNSTYSTTWNPAAQYGIKGTKVEEYPECVRAFGNPISNTAKTVYGIAGTGEYKGYFFYSNIGDNVAPKGRVLKSDGTMGDYTCFNGKIVIDGNYGAAPAGAAAAKQPTQWTKEPATLDDDKNTLKKQMTGEKVKQLQTGLDIKNKGGKSLATGKFWTLTDTKLKQLYPTEYTTQKGVTKTLFDKIVNPTLKASTAAAPTTIPVTGTTPAAGVTPATEITPTIISAPQIAAAAKTTPEEFYNTLRKNGYIQGAPEEGDGRIKYKAPKGETPNLMKDQQDLLTQQMNTFGYDFYRKGNDNRLVYTKR